jgi:uncharacterized protein (TIGR03437 family)
MRGALAALLLAFPFAAQADLNEAVVLQTGQSLNFLTGAVSSSGGDLLFDGRTLTPQGGAKAKALNATGKSAYDLFPESYFSSQAASASTAPLVITALTPGSIFLVVTGGKIAKALVLMNLRTALWIEVTTFGASAPSGMPLVSETVNNSSGIPLGFPNSGIAPSGLFVVRGASLSDPGSPALQSSAPPGLPLSLNGTSLTVVVNGVTTHPALYYTSPGQLAAVLPAATTAGFGTLTVTYRGQTSAPSPIQVVPAALGFNTYNGLAVITDAVSGALLTYTNPGKPGQIVTLWATGLGPDPADSDTTYTAAPHQIDTPLQIYAGGVAATIQYQGSAGFPGVNQINFFIPNNAPTGCWVSLIAVAGDVVSNSAAIPIQKGDGPCVDVETGLTGSQIAPSGGSTFRTGLVSLIHTDSPKKDGTRDIQNSADAAFVKYSGLSYNPPNQVSPGSCILYPLLPASVPNVTGMDAGAISLTGPNGLATDLKGLIKGVSYALLSATALPAAGGVFTFKGAGGADVGPFSLTMNLSTPLTWTNISAAANIDQSKDLLLTWTGGNPGSYVLISSSTTPAFGVTQAYLCKAPADAGQFTVPSYILKGLAAGTGGTLMQNDIYYPLPASGLDVSVAIASVSSSTASNYAPRPPTGK